MINAGPYQAIPPPGPEILVYDIRSRIKLGNRGNLVSMSELARSPVRSLARTVVAGAKDWRRRNTVNEAWNKPEDPLLPRRSSSLPPIQMTRSHRPALALGLIGVSNSNPPGSNGALVSRGRRYISITTNVGGTVDVGCSVRRASSSSPSKQQRLQHHRYASVGCTILNFWSGVLRTLRSSISLGCVRQDSPGCQTCSSVPIQMSAWQERAV